MTLCFAADLRCAQAELVEPAAELVGCAPDHRRQHAQVVAPDREHAAVEVLALELDGRAYRDSTASFGVVELGAAATRSTVKPSVDRAGHARVRSTSTSEVTGQELIGRHL